MRSDQRQVLLGGPARIAPSDVSPIISVFKYEKAVSPYGAFQSLCNVAERVADWYDKDYSKDAPDRNPKGPETGSHKVFHGGGWLDSSPTVRVAQRFGADPDMATSWLGFRCARDVSP